MWNAHFGDLGFECRVDALKFELACLAKPYFRAADLLVAEYEEQVVGFLHLGTVPNADLTDVDSQIASIAALCIVPCDGEDAVARALLAAAEQFLKQQHIATWRFKPMLPDCAFYQGLGPADSMIGATTSERRGCSWVASAGFSPLLPTTQWELDLSTFQSPVDRIQIQIRRSTLVERESEEPSLPWWQACLLGHTEPMGFQLLQRSDHQLLSEVLFWTIGFELQTEPMSIVWLWPPKIRAADLGVEQLAYLLGEACRQFQAERLDIVRSVSSASDTKINGVLRRLGFTAERSGMVFEKKISVHVVE